MAFSYSFGMLLFGRIFVGLGVGVGLAIDPLYIAEISPAKQRGRLVTYSEIALNVGIVLGFTTGLVLAPVRDALEWRIMFLFGAILPMVMIFLVLTIMPESPRWLVSKGRADDAKMVLSQIYPEGFNVDIVIDDISDALAREKTAEQAVGWSVIYNPTPAFRRMLMVGVGTAVAQQAVGIDAIQYYLLDVIEEAGIATPTGESTVLILLGLVKLLFIFVGSRMFDSSGRRPLFFVSLIGMAVALFIISLCFFADNGFSKSLTILGLACYLAFFSVGMVCVYRIQCPRFVSSAHCSWSMQIGQRLLQKLLLNISFSFSQLKGPGAWLIPSEVFAMTIRGKAMSVATVASLSRFNNSLVYLSYLCQSDTYRYLPMLPIGKQNHGNSDEFHIPFCGKRFGMGRFLPLALLDLS
jgi:MFS family permease